MTRIEVRLLTALLLLFASLMSSTPAKADSTVFVDHDASKTFCTPFNGTYTKLTTLWANTAGANFTDSKTQGLSSGQSWACNGDTEMFVSYVNFSCRCFDYWDAVDSITISPATPPNHNTSTDYVYTHQIGCV